MHTFTKRRKKKPRFYHMKIIMFVVVMLFVWVKWFLIEKYTKNSIVLIDKNKKKGKQGNNYIWLTLICGLYVIIVT